jgi:hypothetical protein
MIRGVLLGLDQPDGGQRQVYAEPQVTADENKIDTFNYVFKLTYEGVPKGHIAFKENYEDYVGDGYFTDDEFDTIADFIRRAYDDSYVVNNPIKETEAFNFFVEHGRYNHIVEVIPHEHYFTILIDKNEAGIIRLSEEGLGWELTGSEIEDYDLIHKIGEKIEQKYL